MKSAVDAAPAQVMPRDELLPVPSQKLLKVLPEFVKNPQTIATEPDGQSAVVSVVGWLDVVSSVVFECANSKGATGVGGGGGTGWGGPAMQQPISVIEVSASAAEATTRVTAAATAARKVC